VWEQTPYTLKRENRDSIPAFFRDRIEQVELTVWLLERDVEQRGSRKMLGNIAKATCSSISIIQSCVSDGETSG
jgi:hypothetical protein